MYILVYVDGIIFTDNNKGAIESIASQIGSSFVKKDLRPRNYFLGVEAIHHRCVALFYLKRGSFGDLTKGWSS